jgi:hypothetical protein
MPGLTIINIQCHSCVNLGTKKCHNPRCADCVASMKPGNMCTGIDLCRHNVAPNLVRDCTKFCGKEWDI